MGVRRRPAEARGTHQPTSSGGAMPASRRRPRDVEDWSREQVESYFYDHEEEIERYQRLRDREPDIRYGPQHGKKWWVREYRKVILQLLAGYEREYLAQAPPYYGLDTRQQRDRRHEHDDDDDSE